MLQRPELFTQGFHLSHVSLSDTLREAVEQENWTEVDRQVKILLEKNGSLYNLLQSFHTFEHVEFIISVRNASDEWQEDGIWHDDGSRVFAFSLSLTLNPIEGGRLGIRRQGSETFVSLPTPSFGGIILFLTGVYGFEHKIHQVTNGQRIIIAGWCT